MATPRKLVNYLAAVVMAGTYVGTLSASANEYESQMASAAKAAEAGDWSAAATAYRAAWESARKSELGAPDQAAAALNFAFALRAAGGKLDPAHGLSRQIENKKGETDAAARGENVDNMIQAYEAVIALSEGHNELSAKRELACNNLGVL